MSKAFSLTPDKDEQSKLDDAFGRNTGKITNLQFMGSYHMYHRIDGKLVGVGIFDLVENSMSSLQFCYLPEYKKLNLGTVSTIMELEFMRKLKSENWPKL
jgi:arginyl-tRNA--protein-N-Asp/Glu arginylyltransferase